MRFGTILDSANNIIAKVVQVIITGGVSGFTLTGGGKTITVDETSAMSGKMNITSLHFPFYNSSTVLDVINLTADQKLPFYDSSVASKNIPFTT